MGTIEERTALLVLSHGQRTVARPAYLDQRDYLYYMLHDLSLRMQGRRVVRLKGGCPSVFARVGSELRALAAAGVPVELVPGVSSALAAPLLAGAPASASVLFSPGG